MVKNHLLRLAAPQSWNIERKKTTFVTRPRPGAHALKEGMSINLVLREVLGRAGSTKETKHLLHEGAVLVNGRPIHDHKRIVGFMDVISFVALQLHYRISINEKGALIFVQIPDSQLRILKVLNKTTLAKAQQMISCTGGTQLPSTVPCRVGDTVLIDEKTTIKKVFTLQKGSAVLLTGGSHIGSIGVVKSLFERGGQSYVEVTVAGKEFTTLKQFAFVLGDGKPAVKVN